MELTSYWHVLVLALCAYAHALTIVCYLSLFLLLIIGVEEVNTQEIEGCICGYHVYQEIWETSIDKELACLLVKLDVCPSVPLALACCCTRVTPALASAIAENNNSVDKGPAGSSRSQGTTWKYDIMVGTRDREEERETFLTAD